MLMFSKTIFRQKTYLYKGLVQTRSIQSATFSTFQGNQRNDR